MDAVLSRGAVLSKGVPSLGVVFAGGGGVVLSITGSDIMTHPPSCKQNDRQV